MIALTAVCALAHFSFVILLLEVLLGTLGILCDLFLSLFCSGGFLSFFFLFESTLESLETKAWYLEGLMVPIITKLSCSNVRDSMNSASLGIFQARAVNLVAWKVEKNIE